MNRRDSVSCADYGMDDREIAVRFQAGIFTRLWGPPSLLPVRNGSSFTWVKLTATFICHSHFLKTWHTDTNETVYTSAGNSNKTPQTIQRLKCKWSIFKYPLPTAWWTLFASVTQTSQLLLYKEIIAVCSENSKEYQHTVWSRAQICAQLILSSMFFPHPPVQNIATSTGKIFMTCYSGGVKIWRENWSLAKLVQIWQATDMKINVPS